MNQKKAVGSSYIHIYAKNTENFAHNKDFPVLAMYFSPPRNSVTGIIVANMGIPAQGVS